jgi:hypothetical protein
MIFAAAGDDPQPNRNFVVAATGAIVFGLMVGAWSVMVGGRSSTMDRLARLIWTVGFLGIVIHILLAFELVHGWSHAEAMEYVRRVGGFSAGIIVNYLFVLVWAVDLAWWWLNPRTRAARPRWVGWMVHGFLAFVVVNATIVFGQPVLRGLYGLICILFALAVARNRNAKRERQDEKSEKPD